MARITRNKAAEILGVSRQTISNYIKEGILGSYVGEHGILYVNSEDIEKYAQKYKMIAANEKMIDEKLKKELTKAQAELWFEKELNIRKEAFITKYSLVIDLWRAKWKYENAKVSFIKREITSKEFIAAMGDTEEKIHDISNKIAIADFELKKLYERKQ
mgnify:CR=1 FL=1